MVSKAVRLIRTGTRETHLGQESTLHPKAGYIDADCSRPSAFLLQSRGGPYILARFFGPNTWFLANHGLHGSNPIHGEARDDLGKLEESKVRLADTRPELGEGGGTAR